MPPQITNIKTLINLEVELMETSLTKANRRQAVHLYISSQHANCRFFIVKSSLNYNPLKIVRCTKWKQ